MASGKSTLGKMLAEKIEYKFIDLDEHIEAKEQMSVKKIFKKKGELYFRKAETLYLGKLLKEEKNVVLALGGGTPCYGNNMAMILQSKHVKSFYLKASLPYLAEKLNKKKNKRPLISHLETEDELKEFIGKHLFERTPFYERAQVKIAVDGIPKKELIKTIRSYLV